MNTIVWHETPLTQGGLIKTSTEDAVVPSGLHVMSDFITDEDATNLMNIIEGNSHLWQHKGFEEKKRVQHYIVSLSPQFDWIVDKVTSAIGDTLSTPATKRPSEIIIEERKSTSFVSNRCNTFETSTNELRRECTCVSAENLGNGNCSCYVAQLSLNAECIQLIDRPKERKADCWDVVSPQHRYKFLMEPKNLICKTGESLWNWRSRITLASEANNPNSTDESTQRSSITIAFRQIVTSNASSRRKEEKKDDINKLCNKKVDKYDYESSLPQLLTVIVTTSPIKSNPSTEVLERAFATFHYGGNEFIEVEKLIVCDGVRLHCGGDDITLGSEKRKVTKKYQNAKQALRNGIATSTQIERYELFKIALKKLCKEASGLKSSPFFNTRVIELNERHGYGFALRHALYHEVTTPYVCVIQHDRTFMRSTPIKEVVNVMRNKNNNGAIKYVGFSMRSNLRYRDIFMSKYGPGAFDELKDMILYPAELANDYKYGRYGSSLEDGIIYSESLKKNLRSLAKSYFSGSIQYRSHLKAEKYGKHQLSLTPTIFWFDNIHICETSHYRDFIFDPKLKMVAKGGFVEDKLSPVILKSVERLGLKNGHGRFGSYLLDDHSGYFFTGHLDGGSFMTEGERTRLLIKGKNISK